MSCCNKTTSKSLRNRPNTRTRKTYAISNKIRKYSHYKIDKHGGNRTNNQAVAVISENSHKIKGKVLFTKASNTLKIEYEIYGLTDGEHGFHIHEYGDVTEGCKSGCEHFNPFGKKHGGIHSKERHAGDLGNISSKDGLAKGVISDTILSIDFANSACIIGRMIIIHQDPDDLGKGGHEESEKTGNAGQRVACAVIGLKSSSI